MRERAHASGLGERAGLLLAAACLLLCSRNSQPPLASAAPHTAHPRLASTTPLTPIPIFPLRSADGTVDLDRSDACTDTSTRIVVKVWGVGGWVAESVGRARGRLVTSARPAHHHCPPVLLVANAPLPGTPPLPCQQVVDTCPCVSAAR